MRMRTQQILAAMAAALVLVAPLGALAQEGTIPGMIKSSWDAVDTPVGVYCTINDVRLMAQSAEDCQKAGGSVTHSLTTTVTPINP